MRHMLARRRPARPGRAVRRGLPARPACASPGSTSRHSALLRAFVEPRLDRPRRHRRPATVVVADRPRGLDAARRRRRRPASSPASSTGAARPSRTRSRRSSECRPAEAADDPAPPVAVGPRQDARPRLGAPRARARGGAAAADAVRPRARQLAPVLPVAARLPGHRRDRDHGRHVAARGSRRGAAPDDRRVASASAIRSAASSSAPGSIGRRTDAIGSLAMPIGLAIEDEADPDRQPASRRVTSFASAQAPESRVGPGSRCGRRPGRRARAMVLPARRRRRRRIARTSSSAAQAELAALPVPTAPGDRPGAQGRAGEPRAAPSPRCSARGSPGTRVLRDVVAACSRRRLADGAVRAGREAAGSRSMRRLPRRRRPGDRAGRRRGPRPAAPPASRSPGYTYTQADVAKLLARLATCRR